METEQDNRFRGFRFVSPCDRASGVILRPHRPLANWAGPAMLPPTPSSVWPSNPVETYMRSLAFGYFRDSPGTADERTNMFRDEITAFAEREGFVLAEVHRDHYESQIFCFSPLVDALKRGDAWHAVVPALYHFARSPAIQLSFMDTLERKTGMRVVIMYPSLEMPV
ncbi:hypothetical protein [Salinispora arenicola]|uniref:hypothetical protein n=1 Tax=Salinispora arenicola TaxID=168697 RepID=UPI00169E2714|nr:hypothetical protein [Salinispora arenicola]NIL59419.1 recombinase family protein [Salinispora arenicola]NIL62558.1 recombinase family protein [Salinispora arenicola]